MKPIKISLKAQAFTRDEIVESISASMNEIFSGVGELCITDQIIGGAPCYGASCQDETGRGVPSLDATGNAVKENCARTTVAVVMCVLNKDAQLKTETEPEKVDGHAYDANLINDVNLNNNVGGTESIFVFRNKIGPTLEWLEKHKDKLCVHDAEKLKAILSYVSEVTSPDLPALSPEEKEKEYIGARLRKMLVSRNKDDETIIDYMVKRIIDNPNDAAYYVLYLLDKDMFVNPEEASYSNMAKIFGEGKFPFKKTTWNANTQKAREAAIKRQEEAKIDKQVN